MGNYWVWDGSVGVDGGMRRGGEYKLLHHMHLPWLRGD